MLWSSRAASDHPASARPAPGAPLQPRLEFLRLVGREVFRFAVTRMIELIEQAEIDCREMGLSGVDVLIPHQVNQRIIDAAAVLMPDRTQH